MLRGLARWLAACGYDVTWTYGIDDDALLAGAREQGRIVLTADGGILTRRAVRDGDPPALAVVNTRPPIDQARDVLRRLGLSLRDPRCMACGGALARVSREDVRGEAPPRTFASVERYFRCGRCGRLLWEGSHWERIAAQRQALAAELAAPKEPETPETRPP